MGEQWGVFTTRFPHRAANWNGRPRTLQLVGHGYAPPALWHPGQGPVVPSGLCGHHADEHRWSSRTPPFSRETARLQGLPDSFDFGNQTPATTYRQMGNAVNVGVVWHVLREHVRRDEDILKTTPAGRRIVRAILDAPASPDEILEKHIPLG